MHKCWLVPELTIRIAEECRSTAEFVSKTRREEGQHTLYALARTCRALQEPALDALWYQVDTLAHLVKCLPDDLWTRQKKEAFVELVSLFSMISSTVLCRFSLNRTTASHT